MMTSNAFLIRGFIHESLPQRILFGPGKKGQLANELERLDLSRALVISSHEQAGQAEDIIACLGPRAAGLFPGAKMHTPVEVTEQALRILEDGNIDCLVGFGGGSAIGLAKALSLRSGLPQIAIPTTFAGSEMTPILGQTEHGVKTTLRDAKLLPRLVIYDPSFVQTLPAAIAGPSGMNAMAHAVEALYAENRNPILDIWAEESIRALAHALPQIAGGSRDVAIWTEALYGAWFGGACLGSAGMAIHHKLCHILGGTFDLPHADIHCLLIPYATAYNEAAAPEAMDRIARALDVGNAAMGLYDLMRRVGSKTSLKAFGLSPSDLDKVADLAVANPYYNPRKVTRDSVRQLLEIVYAGGPPSEVK